MSLKRDAEKRPRRVKGCHNCSQRRINCDRNSPCQKCIKKGIECWGLGIRYRFSNGVASRGKLAGKSIPVVDLQGSDQDSGSDQKPKDGPLIPSPKFQPESPPADDLSCTLHHLDHLDQQSRFLLGYCLFYSRETLLHDSNKSVSQRVAPAMVAIDTHNGYRDILLPFSEQDSMIRNSILAASASHLSNQYPDSRWSAIARKYHMAAIHGLNQQSHDYTAADTFSNLATMVILLVEEMVSVGEDFVILLRMVRSFVCSRGGDKAIEEEPMGRFLIQQIRKMTLYAAPLVSEISATSSLSSISPTDIVFLYSLKSDLKHTYIISNIADLVHQAMQIYLLRVTEMPEEIIKDKVQRFIDTASLFNATSFGGHILIWPFFIVGAECSDTIHQQFVVAQLQCLWDCTGFANILYAISFLKRIWQSQTTSTWPKMLVKHAEGLIM